MTLYYTIYGAARQTKKLKNDGLEKKILIGFGPLCKRRCFLGRKIGRRLHLPAILL